MNSWADRFVAHMEGEGRQTLADYLPRQRWFGAKGRQVINVHLLDHAIVPGTSRPTILTIVAVEFNAGPAERYVLFLVMRPHDEISQGFPSDVLFKLRDSNGSETIGPYSDLFALADKRHKLYTKKINAVRVNVEFPTGDYAPQRAAELDHKPLPDVRAGTTILNEANRQVLSRYAPAGVIVDEDLQIIQFRGQTGPFLEPAPGEASLNVLKMAREGLLYDLRAALNDARKGGTTARREKLRVKYNGHVLDVNVEVIPLLVGNHQRHFLVLFEDASKPIHKELETLERARKGAAGKMPSRRQGKAGSTSKSEQEEHIVRLQQELAASREYLQSIIQDLEAANEELQSANEEILSSNEELQSTNEELDTAKEELQSTNEELNTVNEELQGRNEELSRANSDLINLLSSVQVAVVMVASDLRIRRFTPMAEKVLNLIPTDVGRPIGDIKPNIDLSDLEKLILEAVDSVSVIEREAHDRQGVTYLVRIRPYKNAENRIDGAVIGLFDLEAGRQGRAADGRLAIEGLLEVAQEPMLALDSKMRLVAANRAFDDRFAINTGKLIGKPIYELADGQWNIAGLREVLERTLSRQETVSDFTIEHEFPRIGRARFSVSAQRVGREDGQGLILLSINLIQRQD